MRIGSHCFWCSCTPCKALQAHHLYNLSPYLPDFPATIRTPTPPTKLPHPQPALLALLTPQGETGQSRPAHASRCRGSPFPSPHSQSGHGANPLPTPCPPRPGFGGERGPTAAARAPTAAAPAAPAAGGKRGGGGRGNATAPPPPPFNGWRPAGREPDPAARPAGPRRCGQGDRRVPRAHRVVLAAQRRQRTGSCPVGPTSSCRGAAGK